jgi:hypothetical protein
MTREFRTTKKKREAAQKTRADRAALRKPQPNLVDEAVTAALMSELKRLRKGALSSSTASMAALEAVMSGALKHLVDRRGYDADRSREALMTRLSKRRRYGVRSDTQ